MRPTATPAADSPYPDTDGHAASVLRAGPDAEPLDVHITVPRRWRAPPDEQQLSVRYVCTLEGDSPTVAAIVDGVRLPLDEPVRLVPVVIAKPWGREIWYTGMEARGESRVRGDGGELGLGSYLALAPDRLCSHQPIVLLKVLDPHPEPVVGELYLEVHEEKREVYVVTAVDRAAWPGGRGRIRYGVSQSARRAHGSDDAFRRAFLEAIGRYEAAREAVDDGATDLADEERAAREATRAFTAERELATGDVISVPTRVPHSLQHGVRVVEFQTPTYERLIVSSSQRVLTQTGWDSARAIGVMRLDLPPEPVAEVVAPGIDRIVSFDDFGVWRIRLADGQALTLPDHLPYAVACCISGRVRLGGQGLELAEHEAAFIPGKAVGRPLVAVGNALLLVAAPDL